MNSTTQSHNLSTTSETAALTSEAYSRIEGVLANTLDVACAAAARLDDHDQQLERARDSAEVVHRASKRSHKLLDRFSWWRSFGCRSSRAAGKRGQRTASVHAAYRREQKKRLRRLSEQQQRLQQRQQEQHEFCQEGPQEEHKEEGVFGEVPEWLESPDHHNYLEDGEVPPLLPRVPLIKASASGATSCSEGEELPEWMRGCEAATTRAREAVRASSSSSSSSSERQYRRGSAAAARVKNTTEGADRLDRIDGLISQLVEMSETFHHQLGAQNAAVGELNTAVTDALKSSQGATARAAWHVRRL